MFYVAATPLLPYTFVQPVSFVAQPARPVSVQHVVHYHVRHHTNEYEQRAVTPPPPQRTVEHHYHHHYHRSVTPPARKVPTDEDLDARLEHVRDELRRNYAGKRDQTTETVDYYRPPTPITYKQHYDAPKPPRTPRPRSRSRSPSLPRTPLSREPWRSSNQNDYPWRDAHLPGYRQATVERHQPRKCTNTRVTSAPPPEFRTVYGDCIHIVPRSHCELEPPYLKVLNAPVTYLH